MEADERRRRRAEARAQLVDAATRLGYPAEFGEMLADELRAEVSMRRMATYLVQVRPTSVEQIADEMLAIRSLQDSWVRQKISERANASVTAFYNRPRDDEDEC